MEVRRHPELIRSRCAATLPAEFKARFTKVLQNLDLSELPEADRKIIDAEAPKLVPQTDGAYDQIRDLVKTLNIDLAKLNS